MTSCVVLFSGGLDSTTALAWALKRYDRVQALTFDYGQRHRVEVALARRAARRLGVPHAVLKVDLRQVGGSALTDPGIALPRSARRRRKARGPARDLRPFPQRDLPGPGRRLGRGPGPPRPRLRLPRRRLARLPRHDAGVRQGHGEGRPGRHQGGVRRPGPADRRPAHRPGQGRDHPQGPAARGRLRPFRLLLRRRRAPLRHVLVLPLPRRGLEGRRPRGSAPRPPAKERSPMSWTLKVRDKFSAAHYLKEYKGKCEKVHGHTFQVEVAIRARDARRRGHRLRLHRDQDDPGRPPPRPHAAQRGLPLQSLRGEHRPPSPRRAQEEIPRRIRDGLGIRGCVGHLR
ncbi:MAG: 7-cyano-7-deazaguanine synthase [Comamonadaceae bacterium]|nr:7-cyano-7-deazaguanine synthase [Comamonadaceae bacterium]